eukprot:s1963_g15.t1
MQYLQPPLIFSLHRGSEPPAAESCKKAESVGKPESLNFNCTFQALHFQVSALRRSFGRGSVPNTVREVEYQASCFWAHNAVLHPVLAVLLVLATTWPLQKCAVLGTSTVKLTAEARSGSVSDEKRVRITGQVLPHWDREVDAKYDKFNWSPPDEPHATFYPERGPYSSSDESILLSQFEDLAKAGVDSAMCSWWGRKDWTGKRDDADSGANTDELIPSVLEAAEKAGVFVSFHIEPYGGRSPQTFLDDLAYIVHEYGHHPAIWREGPKKLPLFWLYDVSAQHSMQDIAAWKEALDSVRGTELDGVSALHEAGTEDQHDIIKYDDLKHL